MTESWKLLELRSRISRIDTQLVALLAQRFAVASDIQKLKRTLQLPTEDVDREVQVLRQVMAMGADFGLDRELLSSIWTQLFSMAKGDLTAVKEKKKRSSQNAARMPSDGRREV